MDITVARQAMEAFARLMQGRQSASITISFYGGEPLLNWRMVRPTLSCGREIFSDKTQIQWILNTNGTLLTPEISSVLKHEDVDVHISIDGADELSNQYRKSKNGKSVLKRIMESLEILKEQGCRVQFDSCLTDANLCSLHGLIDLAASAGADRIYLALTDCPQSQDCLDIKLVARKIIEAMNYAEGKEVSLGGHWKRAMYGSSNMAGHRNQVPHLVVGPTGEVSFPAYHEKGLGHVKNIEEILSSPAFKETMENWEKERLTCQGCELEGSCDGYLKAMVMYHAGRSDGYERECQLAMGILDELKSSVSQELSLSRQLLRQYHEQRPFIINRLRGTTVDATPSLLEFLDLFKHPTNPAHLYQRYCRPDLWLKVTHLLNINFLIPAHIDEEAQWLEGVIGPDESKIFETEHFFTHYPDGEGYLARDFTDLMEEAYRLLITKGLPHLKKKILIFVCESREEFRQFWGSAPLPEWVNAFVHLGRILVVDLRKMSLVNQKGAPFLMRMAHELVHVFLDQLNCHLPVWLQEGLCEYYSRPYNDSKFKKLAREKMLYGFREMESFVKHSLLDLDDSPVKENICYQQAHSFVAYLVGLQGEEGFLECLRATSLSKGFRPTFEQYYGRSLDDIETEWLEMYSLGNYKKLKPSKNLRIIQNGNKVLLYNAFYGQSLTANPDLLTLIDYLAKGKTLREIVKEYDIDGLVTVIARLYEKGLIVFDKHREENDAYWRFNREQIEGGGLINKLRLNVSNSCNMSCDYCYVDQSTNGRMQWPTAQKALDSFFDLQRRHGHGYSFIRFFGGEPLLNWPLIERILAYVETTKKGINVDYILNTNGTIVTQEMSEKLASRKVKVAVSLDGVGAVHDKYRRFGSGRGSFTVIDSNVDILLKFGCNVGIEATLGNHNFDHLKELIDYMAEKGARYNRQILLALQSMCMVSRQGLDTLPLEEKVEKILEAITYARKRGINIGDGMIHFPFNSFLGKRHSGIYCRAMGEELCIYPNGDIYPCGALKIKLGNIEDTDGVFRSDAYLRLVQRVSGNILACRGCDIEAFCAGGCAADAMAVKGDIFQPTRNCELERAVFRALVREFLSGTEEKNPA